MNLLQGNVQIGIFLLRIVGFLGAILGIISHFSAWTTIKTGASSSITNTGLEGLGIIGVGILGVYLLLLLLNSVYALLPAIIFFPYMLEQFIGVNLLRYMPLESTKLLSGLYLLLPTAAILLLIGSLAPLFSLVLKNKIEKK